MAFINQAVTVLQTLVVALGAGLAVWGVVNLMEGYGNDNPGAKSQGIKQLMAGGGVVLIGTKGHHRPLTGERVFRYVVLVVHDSGVKALKGVDRLLKNLNYRDTTDILYRFIVHLFRSILVFSHIRHRFFVGHQHLYHESCNQQKNGQAA